MAAHETVLLVWYSKWFEIIDNTTSHITSFSGATKFIYIESTNIKINMINALGRWMK